MWTMSLLVWTFLRLAAGEVLPPEAKGCFTFREWWTKHGEPSCRWSGVIDQKFLQMCRYYIENDAHDSFFESLTAIALADNPLGFGGLPVESSGWYHPYDFRRPIFVARLLGALGPSARKGAPLLKLLMQADDLRMRAIAAEALWKVERNTDVVRILTEVLDLTKPPQLVASGPFFCGTDFLTMLENGEVSLEEYEASCERCLNFGQLTYPDSVNWGLNWSSWCRFPERGSIFKHWCPSCRIGFWTLQAQPTAVHETRRATVEALGEIGPPAASAAPMLKALLYDSAPDIAFAAACALWKIKQSPEVGNRIRLLCHENPVLWSKVRLLVPELVRGFELKQQREYWDVDNARFPEKF